MTGIHLVVLPGDGYAQHVGHESEPIVGRLNDRGVRASVFPYPLHVRHPEPLLALRAEIRRLRADSVQQIGLIGFSAGGHLAGLAALAPGAEPDEGVDFTVLGYAITSMETETYRPARLILLGEDATPELTSRTAAAWLGTTTRSRSSPPRRGPPVRWFRFRRRHHHAHPASHPSARRRRPHRHQHRDRGDRHRRHRLRAAVIRAIGAALDRVTHTLQDLQTVTAPLVHAARSEQADQAERKKAGAPVEVCVTERLA